MAITQMQAPASPTLYDDLFLRCNLDDKGTVPATGALCTSPDIIPYGVTPVAKPETVFADFQMDYGQNVIRKQQNYFYLRADNLAPGEVNADVYLYWSPASLLNWPRQWAKNVLHTERGADHITFTPKKHGQQVVAAEPLVWTPEVTEHSCMIARVVTTAHPNPIPRIDTMKELGKWVTENRGMAWRNLNIVDGDVPTWTSTFNYYQGAEEEEVHFLLCCTNIPVGCEVAIDCGTPGPEPLIVLKRTMITNPKSQDIGVTCKVPANFSSNISYSLWTNGKAVPEGATVEMKAVLIPEANSELAKLAVPARLIGMPAHLMAHRVDEFALHQNGPVRAIVMGTHRTVITNKPQAK